MGFQFCQHHRLVKCFVRLLGKHRFYTDRVLDRMLTGTIMHWILHHRYIIVHCTHVMSGFEAAKLCLHISCKQLYYAACRIYKQNLFRYQPPVLRSSLQLRAKIKFRKCDTVE